MASLPQRPHSVDVNSGQNMLDQEFIPKCIFSMLLGTWPFDATAIVTDSKVAMYVYGKTSLDRHWQEAESVTGHLVLVN